MSMKNPNGIIGNGTRELAVCSTVLQPTALHRTPLHNAVKYKYNDVSDVCLTSNFRVEYEGVTFFQMSDVP
jgi:hypothetical protein